NALQIDVELVGCNLRQRSADALAELDLAGEDGHGAVRVDAQPGIEHAITAEAAGQARRGRGLGECVERKRDDQGAAGLEEVAARGHDCISFAAFCTARTMRLCDAQRQRWPLSARRISSLVGRGFFASSALADITMPLPQ